MSLMFTVQLKDLLKLEKVLSFPSHNLEQK